MFCESGSQKTWTGLVFSSICLLKKHSKVTKWNFNHSQSKKQFTAQLYEHVTNIIYTLRFSPLRTMVTYEFCYISEDKPCLILRGVSTDSLCFTECKCEVPSTLHHGEHLRSVWLFAEMWYMLYIQFEGLHLNWGSKWCLEKSYVGKWSFKNMM